MMQRLSRAKRWIKYHLGSHALILMYHRVARLENDPHLLAVTPEHFAAHLEVIRGVCRPVTLPQLLQDLKEGHLLNRAVVVTFDDGYVDNLYHAKPLLEGFEVPATVFVTAGQVGKQVEFWWDELDRILLQPGALTSSLELDLHGSAYKWHLGEASEYSQADYRRDAGWHIECQSNPTVRHRIFRALFDHLLLLGEEQQYGLLEILRNWAGVERVGRPSHRSLTVEELRSLEEGDLVEIGAHTLTHPRLAALPAQEQLREIEHSKAYLDPILKKPVCSFAYPYGSYTWETVAALKAASFGSAVTSDADAVWGRSDPFQLPRLGVRDWDGATFARWLSWWMDG